MTDLHPAPHRHAPRPRRCSFPALGLATLLAPLTLAAPAHALDLRLPDLPDAGDHGSLVEDAFTGTEIGELELSLEEAVTRALENNPGLQAERLGPAIQGTFVAQEQAVFDPVLFAEVETGRDRSVRQLDQIGQTDEVGSTRRSGELGVRQELPTGTDLTLSVRSLRSDSTRVENPQYTARGGITLTQALLRGGRIESNRVRLRQAGLDVRASEHELRGFVEEFLNDVEARYWDLVLAGQQVAIFEESLAVAQRQLEQTRGRIRAGDLPETEEVAARAEVALRRQGLIDARSERAVRQDALARRIQADGGLWDTRLEVTSDPGLERYDLEPMDTWVALARRHRPDVNETRVRVRRNELEVVRTRDGLLPRLDFFVTLGQSGYAERFSASTRGGGGSGYDLAAGLEFELPIGRRAAHAEHDRARLTRQQIRTTLDNMEQLAVEDVRGHWFEAARLREQIGAREETVELQEERLRVEQQRYRAGVGTALALAQAQRDLLESRLELTESVVAFRQARTALLRASGTLLHHRGIEAPGGEPEPLAL